MVSTVSGRRINLEWMNILSSILPKMCRPIQFAKVFLTLKKETIVTLSGRLINLEWMNILSSIRPIMCRPIQFAKVFLTLKKETIVTFQSQYCRKDIISNSHYFQKIRFCRLNLERHSKKEPWIQSSCMKFVIKNIHNNLYIIQFCLSNLFWFSSVCLLLVAAARMKYFSINEESANGHDISLNTTRLWKCVWPCYFFIN